MSGPLANPVVHLELRTENLSRAVAFYAEMFGWKAETVRAGAASYLAFDLGEGIQGGVVERDAGPPGWLPYVEVAGIRAATERARSLGAAVLVEPREGPAGWRSVVTPPASAEIGLWQPKR
jgi:predicted enzyme related to lactoylglutathione lyase